MVFNGIMVLNSINTRDTKFPPKVEPLEPNLNLI